MSPRPPSRLWFMTQKDTGQLCAGCVCRAASPVFSRTHPTSSSGSGSVAPLLAVSPSPGLLEGARC